MQRSTITIKYTMMIVRELEKETGKPVSLYKRIEIQNLITQWYYSIKHKYTGVR